MATLQYTQSVGQPRFKWLGIEEGQHELSHEPNSNEAAQEKLTKINAWYAGEGNSHSHADIPWVMVGDGLGFHMGRAAEYAGVPHNLLLLAIAHAMGHTELKRFGNPDYCGDGPLTGLA